METRQGDVKDYLTHMAKAMPRVVFTRLAKGDRLMKTGRTEYEIDDLGVHRDLGTFSPSQVPYGPISRKLKSSDPEILHILNNAKVFPFSRMYNNGLGTCLEKAIVMQLASQEVRDSLLVSGVVQEDGKPAELHAFNVLMFDGNPWLVDVQNPLAQVGDKTQPYIVPINGMNDDVFRVPQEYRVGRTYSLT